MLLPEKLTTPELAEELMADVRTTCEELGVALGGGHTEITRGIDHPILVGEMLGEVAPTRLVRKTFIAKGDQILLTQGVAIEGSAILAREKSERLRDRIDADVLARAARFLVEPRHQCRECGSRGSRCGRGRARDARSDRRWVAPSGLGLLVIRERIPVFPKRTRFAVRSRLIR